MSQLEQLWASDRVEAATATTIKTIAEIDTLRLRLEAFETRQTPGLTTDALKHMQQEVAAASVSLIEILATLTRIKKGDTK
ncbi:hypothetical protein [Actinomyces sp.]|uniref:hypothetical protein n=1 Tax=Actinomyces sp. TaxID=29317 RepID=UPI0029104BB0|nr:hypothetical protein [Actinomyces sp.]MDU6757696.1 hypothetical protein [Actinomyces sp.]